VRAREFITEGNGVRGGIRAPANHEFERAHPGLVGPTNHGDLYIGRYYDFYRICSLAGMDPNDLDKADDVSFFGNLPIFSAYTEHDRKKLKAIMKKLKMKPSDYISPGSLEPENTNKISPIKSFAGYKR
jgi:hypothetical protein